MSESAGESASIVLANLQMNCFNFIWQGNDNID